MSEVERSFESLVVPTGNTPLVACMGANACRRVCQFVDSGRTIATADPSWGLPGERSCEILDTIENQDPTIAEELLDATTLPVIDGFTPSQAVEKAGGYLKHLSDDKGAFEDYIKTILKADKLPRSVVARAEAAYKPDKAHPTKKTEQHTDEVRATIAGFESVLRGFFDRTVLDEHGVVLDTNIKEVIIEAARHFAVGHHIRLVGEPGVAKTSVAKFIGRINARANHPDLEETDLEPILISFSSTSEAEAQLVQQTFEDGTLGEAPAKLAEAARKGIAVIFDEDNALTADQKIFFNDLLLKKPGQTITVAGEVITIQPGFSVIATRNAMTDTQGNRRQGRQQQDSAGDARLSRIDVPLPYQSSTGTNAYETTRRGDETIGRLFFARYVDNFGWKLPSADIMNLFTDIKQLVAKLVVKATEPPVNVVGSGVSAQARPELAGCLSPRELDRILEVTFTHSNSDQVAKNTRIAIRNAVQQIVNSDNGHYVSPAAKKAVDKLLKDGHFNA